MNWSLPHGMPPSPERPFLLSPRFRVRASVHRADPPGERAGAAPRTDETPIQTAGGRARCRRGRRTRHGKEVSCRAQSAAATRPTDEEIITTDDGSQQS